jgi:hypothetical protein
LIPLKRYKKIRYYNLPPIISCTVLHQHKSIQHQKNIIPSILCKIMVPIENGRNKITISKCHRHKLCSTPLLKKSNKTLTFFEREKHWCYIPWNVVNPISSPTNIKGSWTLKYECYKLSRNFLLFTITCVYPLFLVRSVKLIFLAFFVVWFALFVFVLCLVCTMLWYSVGCPFFLVP